MPTSDNTDRDYDPILPSGKAKLVLTEDLYEAYKALIEKTDKMTNICKVELVIDYVFFEDNTGWHTGITLHPSKSRKDFWMPEGSPDSCIKTSLSKALFRTVSQNYLCAVFEGSSARYECWDDPRGYDKCYIVGDAFHDSSGRTKALRQTTLCPCNLKVSCTYYRAGGSCKLEPILD